MKPNHEPGKACRNTRYTWFIDCIKGSKKKKKMKTVTLFFAVPRNSITNSALG